LVLDAGQGVPYDRAYAIESGSGRFDPNEPKWISKANFLQLMRYERLAGLTADFEEATRTLTLLRGGKQVAKGALDTKLGRQMIEQFLAAFMKSDLRGPPRIVHAEGHHFTDIAAKGLHLVNLASVRDVGRVAGADLDPMRFRANLYFDGTPAWQERSWVGRTLLCGSATLKVFAETGRCEATSVDLKTAQRGVSVPALIERTWGYDHLGLYARVVAGGVVQCGDTISIID
jgi:uncharacterized protein YcbX